MIFPNAGEEEPFFCAVLLGYFFKLGEVSLDQKVVDVGIVEAAGFVGVRGVARGEKSGVVTAIVVNGFDDDVHRNCRGRGVDVATRACEQGHRE